MKKPENWDMEAAKEFFPLPFESTHSALHKDRFGAGKAGSVKNEKTKEKSKKQK